MGLSGPAPTCTCYDFENCPVCRPREQTRRSYHGLPRLAPKPIYRPAEIVLPDDPALLGYLAGLVDGEGCITRASGRLRIQLGMTDEPIIRWLESFGGGKVKVRPAAERRRTCWVWLLLKQADILAFLTAIEPHMRVKRDAARAAIEEINGLMDRQREPRTKDPVPLRLRRIEARRSKAAA